MERYDVVVVGGGPAGFNAVKTVRELYPQRSILLINDREDLQIPCAIPYVVSGVITPEKNRYPLNKVKNMGAELLIDRVVSLNVSESSLFTANGKAISYERLILSTGWIPRRLSVPGVELKNVYYIDVSTSAVSEISRKIKEAKSIVLVGGGFISVGFADLISRNMPDKKLTVVEASNRIASGAFSSKTLEEMEGVLKSQGVEILKGEKVIGFEGSETVERVLLSSGKVEADLVFIFIGFLPNTKLAVDAGINTERGFIKVDRFLRTSADNILAAGNCIYHTSAIDGEFTPGMVASVSARDGRIAGANVSGPQVEDTGIVPAGVTEVGGKFYGFAGYTEELLLRKGFSFKEVTVDSADAYPMALSANPLTVRLYFLKNGKIVGGEVIGESKIVSSMVDLLSNLIATGKKPDELLSLTTVAFPPITPPPLLQPIQEGALRFLKEEF